MGEKKVIFFSALVAIVFVFLLFVVTGCGAPVATSMAFGVKKTIDANPLLTKARKHGVGEVFMTDHGYVVLQKARGDSPEEAKSECIDKAGYSFVSEGVTTGMVNTVRGVMGIAPEHDVLYLAVVPKHDYEAECIVLLR